MTPEIAIELLLTMGRGIPLYEQAISLAIAALKREAEPEPTYTPDAVIPYPYPDTPQPTTKTAAEWFATVEHDGVRKMLLENLDKHPTGERGNPESIWGALFLSFHWDKTVQGGSLWDSCHSTQSWQPAIDWWEQHYGKPEPMPITTPTTPPDNNLRLQIAADLIDVFKSKDLDESLLNYIKELIKQSQP